MAARRVTRGPEYHVTATFRAPLRYVFAWCTDFQPGDDRLEKESFTRKIISRAPRRVVYEDLEEGPTGWVWARHDVALRPPTRWHSESVGSHRVASIDYLLTPLSETRTRLDLRWRRARTALGRPVSKRAIERATTRSWQNFARALEKDYRKSGRRRK